MAGRLRRYKDGMATTFSCIASHVQKNFLPCGNINGPFSIFHSTIRRSVDPTVSKNIFIVVPLRLRRDHDAIVHAMEVTMAEPTAGLRSKPTLLPSILTTLGHAGHDDDASTKRIAIFMGSGMKTVWTDLVFNEETNVSCLLDWVDAKLNGGRADDVVTVRCRTHSGSSLDRRSLVPSACPLHPPSLSRSPSCVARAVATKISSV